MFCSVMTIYLIYPSLCCVLLFYVMSIITLSQFEIRLVSPVIMIMIVVVVVVVGVIARMVECPTFAKLVDNVR